VNIPYGTCGKCGGLISIPNPWFSVTPAMPTCESCGAHPKQKFGPTIEMEDSTGKRDRQFFRSPR
jgi:hypothetical protein